MSALDESSGVPSPTPENGTEPVPGSGNVQNGWNSWPEEVPLSVSFADFCERSMPAPRWLVDELIPDEALVIAVGETGVGKTWFSLFAAQTVSAAGHTVLFVELEGTASGFQDRIKKLGLNSAECHLVLGHAFDLLKPSSLQPLREEISRLQPRLIIFDCFVEAFSGVENDAGDVSSAMKALKALQAEATPAAALLLLHHTGKPGTEPARGQYAARGSSAFDGAADAMLRLSKVANDDAAPQLEIAMTKAREFGKSPTRRLCVRLGETPAFEIQTVSTDSGAFRSSVTALQDVTEQDINQLLNVLPQKTKEAVGKAIRRGRRTSDLILRAAIERGFARQEAFGYVAVVPVQTQGTESPPL